MHCSAEQNGVLEKVPCNAEWDAAVHHLHRLGVCRAAPLPASLPNWPWLTFCKSGGHRVSGGKPANLENLTLTTDAGVTFLGRAETYCLTLDGQT